MFCIYTANANFRSYLRYVIPKTENRQLSNYAYRYNRFRHQGRSDGGYIGIYTPKSVYLIFYVVVLSP